MNDRTSIRSAAALLALLTAPLVAQKSSGGSAAPEFPIVNEDELTLLHYLPQTVSAP